MQTGALGKRFECHGLILTSQHIQQGVHALNDLYGRFLRSDGWRGGLHAFR
jgi:hypothetical protein